MRVSRPVLRGPAGVTPVGYSPHSLGVTESMASSKTELPIQSFESVSQLRAWLSKNHSSSHGLWVRIFKKGTGFGRIQWKVERLTPRHLNSK
jgi:hypothetical protein